MCPYGIYSILYIFVMYMPSGCCLYMYVLEQSIKIQIYIFEYVCD